jgi:hypothetical protein
MEKTGSERRIHGIIIGDRTDSFAAFAEDLLVVCGVDYSFCPDIYDAVSRIALNGREKMLVFGHFEVLGREGVRFFEKCSENGGRCYCLSHGYVMGREKQILAVAQSGGIVAAEMGKIEDEVKRWVLRKETGNLSQEAKKHNGAYFIKEKFLTTKAELDALLDR